MIINYENIKKAKFDTVPTEYAEGEILDMWRGTNSSQMELLNSLKLGEVNNVPASSRFILRAKAESVWMNSDFAEFDKGQAALDPLVRPQDIHGLDQIFASLVEVGNPLTQTYYPYGIVLGIEPGDIGKIYPIDAGGKLHFPKHGDKPVGLCSPDELISATKGYNEMHLWGRKVNPQSGVKVIGYFMKDNILPTYYVELHKAAQENNLPIVRI